MAIAKDSRAALLRTVGSGLLFAALCCATFACLARPKPTPAMVAEELNQDLVRTLRATLRDPARLARAEAIAERIRLAEEFYFARLERIDERLFALDGDYEAAKPDFYPLFEELNELRIAARDEMLALLGELKSQVSRDEWPAIWAEIERGQARLAEMFL